jgi:putative sigma-54 modulation protein
LSPFRRNVNGLARINGLTIFNTEKGWPMDLSIRVHGFSLRQEFRDYVERRLTLATDRFRGRITSLTVQLSDVNGPRGGVDKACLITAVLPGVGEIAVGERAETLTTATDRAAHRLKSRIAAFVSRRKTHEAESIRTMPAEAPNRSIRFA